MLLRMETLLSKRRSAAMRGLPETNTENATINHAEWSAVEEGFRLLERDLTKLQVLHLSQITPTDIYPSPAICRNKCHWFQKNSKEVRQAIEIHH